MQADEELYRRLLDTSPDALVVVDDHGRIVLVNEQTEHMFGYARGELLGQLIEVLVPASMRGEHPGHRARFTSDAPRARPMGSGLELLARRRDGTEFPVEISLSPLPRPEGKLVSAAVRDVSDRRRAEQLTRQLAAIVNSSADAIIGTALDGTITSWNHGAEQIFGYAAREMLGATPRRLMPADRQDEEDRILAAVSAGDMVERLETVRRHKDGRTVDVSVTVSPIRDPAGRLVGTSRVIRDITERRRLELANERIRGHLMNAVESIEGAFAIFDASDRLVLCNSACRLLWTTVIDGAPIGKTSTELLDANLAAGAIGLGDEPAESFRARYLAYHANPVGSFTMVKNGRSLRLVKRRTAEGGTVSLTTDVTEDVEREEELRRASAAATAANSAKSEFLASMSHELRTPLNAILGFAQLLQRDRKEPLSERHQERLAHILKGGEHLLHLIDEVLDLSRIEAGRVTVSLEPVDLDEVLADVGTTLEPMAARAAIHLQVQPPAPDLPPVLADRTRLRQILMNFGSNAIKYGRAGGHATIAASRQGGVARVTIADDGVGIPADKQDQLFQPFHRLGQETGPIEGTGIGLAITKRLAELMGGTVGCQSVSGRGSEFWVELPVYEAAAATAAAPGPQPGERTALERAEGRRFVVVYIEDNPSNLAFMTDLIADFGRIELVTAPSAEIGIELVRARHPDLVIMDINLPGMSGIEATQRLREWPETRDIPVVALSAAAMVRDTARIEATGFHRFLTKPVKVDQLTRVLEELLVD